MANPEIGDRATGGPWQEAVALAREVGASAALLRDQDALTRFADPPTGARNSPWKPTALAHPPMPPGLQSGLQFAAALASSQRYTYAV